MSDDQLQTIIRKLDGLSGEFAELRDGVSKAIKLAKNDDPEMALTRARKVLQYVIQDVFARSFQEEPGTRPLENLLQRLVKEGRLPKRLYAYANHIRELGNLGAHAHGEQVTIRDVQTSLEELVAIIEWYFEAVLSIPLRVKEEPAPETKPGPAPEPKTEPKPEPKPEPAPTPKPEPAPSPKPDSMPWPAVVVGLLLAGLALVLFLKLWPSTSPRPVPEPTPTPRDASPTPSPTFPGTSPTPSSPTPSVSPTPAPAAPVRNLEGTIWRGTSGPSKNDKLELDFRKGGEIVCSLYYGIKLPHFGKWELSGRDLRVIFPSTILDRGKQTPRLSMLTGTIEGDKIRGRLIYTSESMVVGFSQDFVAELEKSDGESKKLPGASFTPRLPGQSPGPP